MSSTELSDPARLNHLLGPVLKSASGRTAWSRVSAVVTRGLSEGIPSEDIRLWITINAVDGSVQPVEPRSDRTRHDLRPVAAEAERSIGEMAFQMRSLAEGRRWGPLLGAARERASSSKDCDGVAFRRDRLRRGGALLAGLLLELPGEGGASRNARLRSSLAVIGKMWLDEVAGYDSVILTHELLALQLGCATKTAARALEDLRATGLVTRSRSGRWIAGRYRIVRLRHRERLRAIGERRTEIEDLVDGKRTALTTLIRSVDHPTWGYSSVLTHQHWMMLMADVAHIIPDVFGIKPATVRKLRGELKAHYHLSAGTVDRFLVEVLDRLGDDLHCGTAGESAGARKARAAEEYDARVQLRRQEREVVRDAKATVYAALDRMLARSPVPASPFLAVGDAAAAREEQFLVWVDQVHRDAAGIDGGADLRARLVSAMGSRLAHSGYPAKFASTVAAFIVEAGPGYSLGEWLDSVGRTTDD